jgi:hypothetical protein
MKELLLTTAVILGIGVMARADEKLVYQCEIYQTAQGFWLRTDPDCNFAIGATGSASKFPIPGIPASAPDDDDDDDPDDEEDPDDEDDDPDPDPDDEDDDDEGDPDDEHDDEDDDEVDDEDDEGDPPKKPRKPRKPRGDNNGHGNGDEGDCRGRGCTDPDNPGGGPKND